MKSFVTTLILEQSLDLVPDTVQPLYGNLNSIFNPVVAITEEDCGTYLGLKLDISTDLYGRTNVRDSSIIDRQTLSTLVNTNQTGVSVRSLSSCVAIGGVCRACLLQTRPNLFNWIPRAYTVGQLRKFTEAASPNNTPKVGDFTVLGPEFTVQQQQTPVDNGNSVVTLLYSPEQYDRIDVYVEGRYVPSSAYAVVGTALTFTTPVWSKRVKDVDHLGDETYIMNWPGITGSTADLFPNAMVTVRYVVKTRSPFFYWLTNTYSGFLIGAQSLPVSGLTIRKALHRALIPAATVELLAEQITASTAVPTAIISYLPTVKDLFEKAVFVAVVASIYLVQ